MSNVSSSNGLEKYPKLRFKGFSEPWISTVLSDTFKKNSKKNTDGAITNVICNSAKNGLIPQREYFDKDIANADNTDGYYIIEKDDFVYNPRKSAEAPYGPVSIYKYAEKGIVSPLYLCFRALHPINADFFDFYFKSSAWHRYVYLAGDSGARHDRVSIRDDVFFAMPINLPSEAEQRKISSLLSSIEKRIKAQAALVENLKKYKRGVIYELFVNPDSQFDVEMAAIPMSQLLTEYRNRNTEGLRVCSVAVSRGVVDQIEHLGRSFAASDTSHYGRVKFGDVVYTKSPTGDFPFGIVKQSKLNEEVAVSPLYGVYTPASYATGNLIHAYFEQYQYANNYICTLAQKGAKNTINITNQRFLEKSIRFPVKESDREYFSALLDMLTEKAIKAEKMLEYLLAQKRTLLAKMFI